MLNKQFRLKVFLQDLTTKSKRIYTLQQDFTLFFMFLARLAYLSVFRVSMKSRSDGDTQAIMSVRLQQLKRLSFCYTFHSYYAKD